MNNFFQLISSMEFLSILNTFEPLQPQHIPLDGALDRVLAEEIKAAENLPPFTRSTMDGFAVRAKDTFGCSDSEPALLEEVGEVLMGSSGRQFSLKPGQMTRIWTGGELPEKADSVAMVEYSRQVDEKITAIFRPVAPGENVIRAGDDYVEGEVMIKRGQQLRPQELGILAGLGRTTVPVYRRPRVAILSTGDELIPPGQQPGPGQIRDINSTTMTAMVQQAGGQPLKYGIVGDELASLEQACSEALDEADILLLSGGSSVGRRDFTLQVFERMAGTEILAHGISIRPGKPTILGKNGNKALIGLPGNIASAMVVFLFFVRPLLRLFSGRPCNNGLRQVTAKTAQPIPSTIGREEYVRVILTADENKELLATPVYGKSGLLKPLVQAQGLLVIDRDTEGLDQDVTAPVLLFP